MISLTSTVPVTGVTAEQISDFMLNCNDDKYSRWWPGTHFQFHAVRSVPGHVGSLVYFDEYVGKRRLRMYAVVEEAEADRIVWRVRKLVNLPSRLIMEIDETDDGVVVTHRLEVGFEGIGSLFDPILRLYLNDEFEKALDEHAHTEFPMLARMLNEHAFD